MPDIAVCNNSDGVPLALVFAQEHGSGLEALGAIRDLTAQRRPICWTFPFPTERASRTMARAFAIARMEAIPCKDAANSLLVSINSLFCAIKFPVPTSRELSSNKLILLRSVGQILA